jgi:enamine deaminase RidA (YjgF/YER057c/UK114 family)
MKRKLISTGSTFEDKIGYSRAVIQGDWVFVSGTTGYNYETMTISDDIVEQTEQCFINIKNTLKQAESNLSDVVRITYILANASDFESCWPVLQKYLGNIKPAATMFAAGLADKSMKIEIQVTALKQSNT